MTNLKKAEGCISSEALHIADRWIGGKHRLIITKQFDSYAIGIEQSYDGCHASLYTDHCFDSYTITSALLDIIGKLQQDK